MTKKLQIELPDDIHAAMLALSQVMGQSPEEMAAEWVTMAVTAITGKPLRIAKSMSLGSPVGTPLGTPLEMPIGMPGSMSAGISPYDVPGTRDGKRPQSKGTLPAPNKEAARAIYQLKVTLKDSKPPIWRRLQVPGSITLLKLHRVLQVAMGWEDYHLHSFVANGLSYGTTDPDFPPLGTGTVEEQGVKLCQIAPDVGARFVYNYDFGDSWHHQVAVEKLLPAQAGAAYPVCIAGKRACPPEDVGGIWSYDDFLDVIRNPSHPEHDELLEWAGGDFDPERFDLEAVNSALKRVR